MDDADARRDDPQTLISLLRPFQEPVAFVVALELAAQVALHRAFIAPMVDLQGMVHDQVHRNPGVHPRRVPARLGHRVAQRRQVLQYRQAAGVRKDHPRDMQRQVGAGMRAPIPEPADLVLGHGGAPCAMAQQVLEQHADDIGICVDVAPRGSGGGGEVRVAQRPAATGERLDHGSGNRENLN